MAELVKGGPILMVDDVRKSLDFYTSKLGFEEKICYPNQDKPTYGSVERGGVEIHISLDGTPADGERVFVWVKGDIDALHAEFRAKGVRKMDPHPTDEAWGGRIFNLYDEDGHHLQFLRGPGA